jgi:hypothetical protein
MRGVTQDVILVEPWYAKTGHVPFNRAFLTVIREAFPGARITFACSPEYRSELGETQGGRNRIAHWIDAVAWTQSTTDGGVGEFWRRARWLVGLLGRVRNKGITPTHLIILGSSGPLLLAAFAAKVLRLPRSCKTFTVLHGVNGLFHGWRPRNPLLRLFTFRTAIKLLPAMDIKVIALEMFIAQKIRDSFPRQAKAILCIPHGYDETESLPASPPSANAGPLRILFLGQATPHKGFAEFVRLAELARASGNAQMEFRAAGSVRQDTRDIDQSALSRRAGDRPLERRELLAELSTADLVFAWQSEYYELTPSGMLLDCIGLGVPMVGRRSHAIAMLEADYGACGLFANDIESLFSALAQLDDRDNRRRQTSTWRDSLRKARIDRSARVLGVVARRELES